MANRKLSCAMLYRWFKCKLKPPKNEPSSMKSYVKVRADLELENGLLYRRIRLKDHEVDTYQLVVPVAYRKIALELLHDKFGHFGYRQDYRSQL